MPAKKSTRRAAAPKKSGVAPKKARPEAESKANGAKPKLKVKGAAKKKAALKTKEHGLAAKLGEMLDTVTAGAIVGAITGAVKGLADEPTAVETPESATPAGQVLTPPSTIEVIEELAPAAAVGAVIGAAKAVMPRAKRAGRPKR